MASATVVFAACQDAARPIDPLAPTAALTVDAALARDSVIGVAGPGAIYALYRPAAWNGSLVLFAHGAVPPQIPLRLPPVPLRDALLARGYGFAYSSRSET